MPDFRFSHRLARMDDVPVLKGLMEHSIAELLKPYLPPEGVEASFAIMGLDTQLIADETYFIIEANGAVAGCGGWSKRATLFGGDHTQGRDAVMLDPKKDAARVRAMYTHPNFVRRGIGRLILQLCESAAKSEGYSRLELAATLAGFPLYTAYGFREIGRFEEPTPSGVRVPLIRMEKEIS
jgi:GNAT superfamily N-acetyltransferase